MDTSNPNDIVIFYQCRALATLHNSLLKPTSYDVIGVRNRPKTPKNTLKTPKNGLKTKKSGVSEAPASFTNSLDTILLRLYNLFSNTKTIIHEGRPSVQVNTYLRLI